MPVVRGVVGAVEKVKGARQKVERKGCTEKKSKKERGRGAVPIEEWPIASWGRSKKNQSVHRKGGEGS